MKNNILKDKSLLKKGFKQLSLKLPLEIKEALNLRDWAQLDQIGYHLCRPDGLIFNTLSAFHEFDTIEHLINIRNYNNDEDGIWHDDGSRYLAFSLSLNFRPESIDGGELFLREKSNKNEIVTLSPLPFGEMIVFLTGQYNFEHKVGVVTKGERICLAGWCS